MVGDGYFLYTVAPIWCTAAAKEPSRAAKHPSHGKHKNSFQCGEMLFLSHSIREITDFIRVKLSFAGTKQYKRHFRPVFRSPMAQV